MPDLTAAQAALEQYFSFSRFREGQADVLRAVFAGFDTIVVMPTGGGKSLCYQLPALLLPGVTIVISPLIALMKDQVDALAARDIEVTFINSSVSVDEQHARVRAMQQGKYKLVYIAPERFRNQHFVAALRAVNVSLFAVDEAHCISQWGHDFRPDYRRLTEALAALAQNGSKRPQVIALTATATPTVREDIARQLGLQQPATFVAGFDRHNLNLRVVSVKTEIERLNRAAKLVEQATGPGIVYAATRKKVEEVTTDLQARGQRVMAYHAGLSDQTRARIQERFMNGELQAIIATNAFGMGIDKRNLRFVTHANMPGSLEAYYQEVGRAGRDGLPSICSLLFNYVDTRIHEFFIEGSHPPREWIEQVYACLLAAALETVRLSVKEISAQTRIKNEIAINSALVALEKAGHLERVAGGYDDAQWRAVRLLDRVAVKELRVDWGELARREQAEQRKLRDMLDYAYHEQCLRKYILRYFGDRKEVTNCRCSNCRPGNFVPKIIAPKDAASSSVAAPASPMIAVLPSGPRALSESEHLAVRKILSCVARLDGRFGKSVVASVLRGSKAKNILSFQLDELSTYGLLGEYSQDELTRFLNALIVAGCVTQSAGQYPTVGLTALGKEVMLDRQRIALDLEAVEADTSDEAVAPDTRKPRSETHEQTFALYEQGLNIEQIAAERNLKALTIEQHLAELLEQGRAVRVEDFVNAATRSLIEAAAQQHGLDKMRPIKDAVPESVSYTEIRFVVAALRAASPAAGSGNASKAAS